MGFSWYCGAVAFALLLPLLPPDARAGEFDAAVAPPKQYVVKVYPKAYLTTAFFDDARRRLNLSDVTGLLYVEVPTHVWYGLTGSISVGAIVPLGWTYQEMHPDVREHSVNRFTVRECWVAVQHRWLTWPFVAASHVRVKIPLADKKDWEDGLRIGDGQVDVFPVLYLDYYSETRFWYAELALGYKYRFKKDELKPLDEANVRSQLGYELIPDFQMRFFFYADFTHFRNGDVDSVPEEDLRFFHTDGNVQTYGYGVSLWPRPSVRLELSTAGDWTGRSRYRGMHWLIGITKII